MTLNSRMSSALHKLNHVEKGEIKCGVSTDWTHDGGSYGAKYLTKKFTRRYTSPPVVFTSVRMWGLKPTNSWSMLSAVSHQK